MSLAALAVAAALAIAAPSANAYEDTWGWKTCSGCELRDPGGYHLWEWVGMSHVGGTAMNARARWPGTGERGSTDPAAMKAAPKPIAAFPTEKTPWR